ncbi:hypothetical protein AWZ03_013096 [Drosophila navojoa]|uniref:Uncharacterized protein n=1 Tax=Drosophila navojoa TaxID=7232 RepID=A0A484AV48_DRONA|nr:hypothetical protein AWZ03_013096 [Drosophila navojoa]
MAKKGIQLRENRSTSASAAAAAAAFYALDTQKTAQAATAGSAADRSGSSANYKNCMTQACPNSQQELQEQRQPLLSSATAANQS